MRRDPFGLTPDAVVVGGRSVSIDPSFRVGVAIEMEALSSDPDVVGLLHRFYLGRIPEDVSAAVQAMLDFYRGPRRDGDTDRPAKASGRAYDFDADAEVIMSSFLSCYGIDLTTTDMHWWTFRRLLFNLPPDSGFMQRIAYRTVDLSGLSGAQRKHYKRMRDLYAIRDDGDQHKMTAAESEAALLAKVERRYQEAAAQLDM